jgi:hypothetical protein
MPISMTSVTFYCREDHLKPYGTQWTDDEYVYRDKSGNVQRFSYNIGDKPGLDASYTYIGRF